MFFHRWLKSVRRSTDTSRSTRRPGSAARRGARPRLEWLEDRTLLSVTVGTNFKGLDTTDAGGVVEPPDPIAAAGPTAVVELVNSNIAFYDKATGHQLASQGLDAFFAKVDAVDSLFSDVSVTYDEQAGRFFVSTMDIDFFNLVSYFDFAVSNDANPMDGFSAMHQVNTTEVSPITGETLFTDFPRLGWNADAYVVQFNMFGFQTENPYNLKLLTIQKSTVLGGSAATLTDYQVDRPLPNSTLVPAVMHGSAAGGPLWLVEEKGLEQDGSLVNLRVVKMTNLLSAAPTFTDSYVGVAPYTITPFPADTQGQVTTALDTRILSADWRNDQLALAQNVGTPGDTDVHARWYELSTAGTPSLLQQGTIAPGPGVDTEMPSVALGTDGSIGMTYLESSPTENLSMYVTGRLPTAPAGVMEPGVLVKAGEMNYQGTRTGDFSGITLDPTAPGGNTFWAVNEYANTASDPSVPNWGTWIATFSVQVGQSILGGITPPAPGPQTPLGRGTVYGPAVARTMAAVKNGTLGRGQNGLLLEVPSGSQGSSGRGHGGTLGGGISGSQAPPSIILATNFKGLDTTDAGGVIEPPDPIAAAGPTAVVELVNSNIAFYDKATGHLLASQGLDAFFAKVDSVDSLFSDVSVTYDEQAGRFFVSTMDIDFFNLVSYFDFAVSNDANPLHGFSEMHQVDTTEVSPITGETLFTDFPRLGWNADAYVLQFNMFGFQTQNPYNLKLLTIQKSTVLDGNPATLTDYQVDRPLPNSTLVPAAMHGSAAGGPLWLVEEKGLEQDGSLVNLRVVKMTNLLSAAPTFTDSYVPVAGYTITPFPGDTQGQVTTALDTRILSADWRNNQLVLAQNVGTPGDTDVHAQWYELSTAGAAPSLLQQGTIAPGPGVDTEMPSVALGTDGSIGMTYLESSPTENLSMYVTGHSVGDPLGTMAAGVLVKAGEMNYQGTRTGDFSGITLDPTAPGGNTFWAVNEYAITASDPSVPNWGTWIAQFQVLTPVFSWTGNGTTTNWTDPNNWSGGVAPGPNADLLFGPSATNFTSTNDFPAGSTFGSITLTASGYAISGHSIVLTGGLDGSGATGANTFGLNVTLSAAEMFQAGSGATDLTVSGTVNNGGFLLTVAGGDGALDFTNVLSGGGGLALVDTGTTTLSGTGNTFTGATTVQAGTLVLAETSGNAIPGALTVSAATVRLNASNQIADAAAVTVTNGGLLDTNGNSDTIGPLTLSGSFVTTEAGALTFTGKVTDSGASSLTGNLALGSAVQTFTLNSGGTLTVGAVISGSGGLTANGTGTLLLAGSNTYAGGTVLSGAMLALGNANALGSGLLTIQSGTVLAAGAAVSVANAVKLAGNVTIGGSLGVTFTGAITLIPSRTVVTTTNTGPTTFAGVVGQASVGLILTKTGAGTLVLSNSNTYSGGTALNAGTLALGNANALGSGLLAIQGGTVRADGAAVSVANAVRLAGDSTVAGSLDLTFTGAVTLTGSRALIVTNTGTTTLAGVIGETGGSWYLTKAGAGTLVLGNNNTFSKGVKLNAGTLAVGNNGALGTGALILTSGTLLARGTAIALGNPVTLADTVTIGGGLALTLNGAVTLTGNRTLIVSNTAPTTFAGVVGQSSSGFRLTKAGTGTLVLGAVNTYTGTTTVSGGTLLVTGSVPGAVSVAGGGTLGGSGSTGAVQVLSGGTLMPGSGPGQPAVLSTGNVTLNSGSNFTVALNGTAPGVGGYDQLNVTGTVHLTGSTLNVSVGYAAAVGDAYTIIANHGAAAVVGTFQNLAEGGTFVQGGMTFQITYKGGTGKDVGLTRIA